MILQIDSQVNRRFVDLRDLHGDQGQGTPRWTSGCATQKHATDAWYNLIE